MFEEYRCIDCRFFDPEKPDEPHKKGLCRKRPPTGDKFGEVVGEEDWCAEFVVKPTEGSYPKDDGI